MVEERGDGVPAWLYGPPAAPPGDEFIAEIVFGITTTEVVDSDSVDSRVCREVVFQVFQILAPIVVGIGGIEVALEVTAGDRIEIGEVVRVGEEWGGCHDEEKNTEDYSDQLVSDGLSRMALVEVGQGLADEEVEEWKDREEVTESDVQVAGDADVAVKQDEKNREILSDVFSEGVSQELRKRECSFLNVASADTVEAVSGRGEEKKEKGQRFFEGEDDREVRRIGFGRNGTHVVVDVAGSDSREDLGDTDEVFGIGKEDGRLAHADDEIVNDPGWGVGLGKEEIGMGCHFRGRHAGSVGSVEYPDEGEADDDDTEKFPRIGEEGLKKSTDG